MNNRVFVEIYYKDKTLDSQGAAIKNNINDDLKIDIKEVNYSELYFFSDHIPSLKEIIEKYFIDPIIQDYVIGQDLNKEYDYSVEVMFNDDVTDNAGIVAEEALADCGVEGIKVRTGKKYYLSGVNEKEANRIAKELLANEMIEKFKVEKK